MISPFSALSDIREALRNKTVSAAEVFDMYRSRIDRYNPTLQAFHTIHEIPATFPDSSSALAGMPIAYKDLYCERGRRTTASSKMLENFVPPYDATVVKRLTEAGAISIGKTITDEFAMGGSGENSAFEKPKNPWDPTRIPGGSSAGSAVAVSAGLIPAACGTDTGGSIRQPASMCGIVGFKPTYGRNSRYGVIPMASSLDTPGTLSRTVRDAGMIYEITAGRDPLDSTSLPNRTHVSPDIWTRHRLDSVKIGVPKEYFVEGIDPGVRTIIMRAIDRLADLGADVREISLPHTEYALATYYIIMPAEASTNLARYDGIRYGHTAWEGRSIAASRAEGFGPEVKRRIMMGTFVLSAGFYDAYYRKASLVRELIREDFARAFEEVDAIVTPTAPTVAWKFWQKVNDPVKMYLEDVFTVPASLAGLPAMSVPVGYARPEDEPTGPELPVGLQIMGAPLAEERMFEVGHVLERSYADEIRVPEGYEE